MRSRLRSGFKQGACRPGRAFAGLKFAGLKFVRLKFADLKFVGLIFAGLKRLRALFVAAGFALALGGGAWRGMPGAAPGAIVLDYGRFALLFDCAGRTALRYRYSLDADHGHLPRPPAFRLDPALPPGCAQQGSAASYAGVHAGYDRGHLVTSNHMDDDARALAAANYMTNIVPQASRLNQGIWVRAENIAECYRDIAPLDVFGGVRYEDGAAARADDFYVASHGIRTPEYFWKAVLTSDPATGAMRAIAWYVPNRADAGPLDRYLVSLRELLALVGPSALDPRVPPDVLDQKPAATWPQPADCALSLRAR
jgi:endonuclease G